MATSTNVPRGRLAQIRASYAMARKADPRLGLVLAATFLGVLLLSVLLGLLLHHPVILTIFGVLFAVMVTAVIFGRRAERAAYSQIAGQPGAGAAVLQSLRKGWTVSPAVAVNRSQDLVHRAVGRPGIVLVGEGSPARVSQLIVAEKKKLGRIVPDVPVYDFMVGEGEDQIRLTKLQRTLMKLPRNIPASRVAEVERRLKAMGGMNVPVPKGPMPKGARMPKGPTGPPR